MEVSGKDGRSQFDTDCDKVLDSFKTQITFSTIPNYQQARSKSILIAIVQDAMINTQTSTFVSTQTLVYTTTGCFAEHHRTYLWEPHQSKTKLLLLDTGIQNCSKYQPQQPAKE